MLSTIDWNKFFEAQKKLDSRTFQTRGLCYDSTSPERFLAMVVELNEFANATKVFKYWSSKVSDRDQTLDEYADVFHFILAIFIERKIDPTGISYPSPSLKNNRELTLFFLSLASSCYFDMGADDFKNWVQRFLELGSFLGFSLEDLEKAYWKKWNVNLERQNSGY